MECKNLGKVGLIGRFKPVHHGAKALLEAVCRNASNVIIGIGSSNKYNARNPFTAQESEQMVRLALENYKNFQVVHVPDSAHIPEYSDGKKWAESVKLLFGNLDNFVTSNQYVDSLLSGIYKIFPSSDVVEPENRIKLKASEVRLEMAMYGDWKKLVPEKVADYLEENDLVERFRQEFGLETLGRLLQDTNELDSETAEQEEAHAKEK
jgi:nicotinamide-nucleotide adenylyltransferase